eukprot:Opistho-2@86546
MGHDWHGCVLVRNRPSQRDCRRHYPRNHGQLQVASGARFAVTAAKLSGDFCSHSLYHILLNQKGITFLPDTPTKAMDRKMVDQIMQLNPVVLSISETVASIKSVLASNTHNGFPVVEFGSGKRRLAGLLLREQITNYFASNYQPDETIVNLGSIMHLSPQMVTIQFTASQAYTLFRNLGLRHLCVINRDFDVVGIITRKDLIGNAHYDEAMTDVEVFAEHTLASLRHTVDLSRRRSKHHSGIAEHVTVMTAMDSQTDLLANTSQQTLAVPLISESARSSAFNHGENNGESSA